MSKPPRKDDRLFVRDGRRHHRKRWSKTEPRVGLGVLAALGLVLGWVLWRGAHPDPELFTVPMEVLDAGSATVDRGPLPEGLAAAGWREGPPTSFDASNLYEKIDGREDYYKSFGFLRLWFVTLLDESDPARTVDLELFDLGTAPNALGAYAGERPPETRPALHDGGLSHASANARFLTRGRYYARAIGADTTAATRAQLEHLSSALGRGLPGEPLPWAYALFAGEMGIDPGRVSYMAENAFSFGFARRVYAALLAEPSTEVFVVAGASAEAAREMAERYRAGFQELGSDETPSRGDAWIRERYQGTFSGATSEAHFLLGVRGAPDVRAADRALAALRAGVRALPVEVAQRALREAGEAPDRTAGEPSTNSTDSGSLGSDGEPGYPGNR